MEWLGCYSIGCTFSVTTCKQNCRIDHNRAHKVFHTFLVYLAQGTHNTRSRSVSYPIPFHGLWTDACLSDIKQSILTTLLWVAHHARLVIEYRWYLKRFVLIHLKGRDGFLPVSDSTVAFTQVLSLIFSERLFLYLKALFKMKGAHLHAKSLERGMKVISSVRFLRCPSLRE